MSETFPEILASLLAAFVVVQVVQIVLIRAILGRLDAILERQHRVHYSVRRLEHHFRKHDQDVDQDAEADGVFS
jgi:hypothetical protein